MAHRKQIAIKSYTTKAPIIKFHLDSLSDFQVNDKRILTSDDLPIDVGGGAGTLEMRHRQDEYIIPSGESLFNLPPGIYSENVSVVDVGGGVNKIRLKPGRYVIYIACERVRPSIAGDVLFSISGDGDYTQGSHFEAVDTLGVRCNMSFFFFNESDIDLETRFDGFGAAITTLTRVQVNIIRF